MGKRGRRLKIGCVTCGRTREVREEGFYPRCYCSKCGKATFHVVEKINVEIN